jgi:hypothetical protein
VRAGLAGIMDIQIVVITRVPVTGGAGAANRVLLRLALAGGRIWPVAHRHSMERIVPVSGVPGGATVVESARPEHLALIISTHFIGFT